MCLNTSLPGPCHPPLTCLTYVYMCSAPGLGGVTDVHAVISRSTASLRNRLAEAGSVFAYMQVDMQLITVVLAGIEFQMLHDMQGSAPVPAEDELAADDDSELAAMSTGVKVWGGRCDWHLALQSLRGRIRLRTSTSSSI